MTVKTNKKLGSPPTKDESRVQNLKKAGSNEPVPLNFYVPGEFRRDYKVYAAEKEMSMVEILKRSFELYKSQNPT